VTDWS